MKGSRFLVAAAVALLASSCATDVGDIDRTQHDKLEKKLFQGVWYMNQTVIDIPYNAAFTFVGETNFGATGKVIFDIQETSLVVYPVVEYVEGSEEKWHTQRIFKYWDDNCLTRDSEDPAHQCADGVGADGLTPTGCCFIEVYTGQPVAAFEIVSHFDVKRQYNAQTGEQTRIIEENTTDKLWWQRSHMRVNWSKNLINDFTFMARMVQQSPLDYYVQSFDADNPDAPTLTPDYIDVVTKVYGEPTSTGACDIYQVSTGDCAPALVKFRTAFRKVDPAQDYEPQHYSNEDQMRLFGFFLTERYSFNEDYGFPYTGRVSFVNRWNLWRHSFDEEEIVPEKPCFKDLKDTGCDRTNVDGTKEFCRAEDWFTYGKCVKRRTKPYTERGLRPIVYHVSANLPPELWKASVRTAEEWSKTMQEAVAWMYFWEEKGAIRGQEHARVCESDADCAAGALAETLVELDKAVDLTALPLIATRNAYKTGSPRDCTADSACLKVKLCDASTLPPGGTCPTVGPTCVKDFVIQGTSMNYCATCSTDADCPAWGGSDTGTCVRGVCMTGNYAAMAKTVLLTPGHREGVEVPDWGIPNLTDKTTGAPLCAVRLLNLNAEPASLVIDGKDVQTDVPTTVTTTDPAAVPYATLPANGKAVSVKVTSGGAEVASLEGFACNGNSTTRYVTTFALSGSRLVAATSASAQVAGLRVFNLLDQAVDVSIDGALRFANLKPGVHTGFVHVGGGTGASMLPADIPAHRVVAMPAGAPGDITCFRSDEVSRCVGYRPQLTDADWDRVEQIKASLPPLFVMCPNRTDPADPDSVEKASIWKSRLYGPWTEVGPAVAEGRTDSLPEKNPCVDFLFGFDRLERRMSAEQAQAELAKQAASIKKAGDSRYSSIYWVPEAQYASPLGYGPSAADPDTGEIFWATANIYGAPLYTIAAQTRDLFDIINGKLDTQDYILGKTIREYIHGEGTGAKTGAVTSALESPLPAIEVPPVQANVRREIIRNEKGRPMSPYQIAKEIRKIELGQQLPTGMPRVDPSFARDRLSALAGTPWEQLLMSDEVRLGLGADAREGSPLEWANLETLMKKERDRQILLSSHNYCTAGFNDEGMLGIARSWGCKAGDSRPQCGAGDFDPLAIDPTGANRYKYDANMQHCCINDGEQLYQAILTRYYLAVVEHEVGHTVGLRHNFEGSSDLFNFQDEYYDIREKEPIPCGDDQECELALGQSCVSGYCTVVQPTTCDSDAKCGYFFPNMDAELQYFNPGHFACEAGRCVERKRCGMHGECPEGTSCSGEDWTCRDAEGRHIATPVDAPAEGTVVRQMIPRGPMTENEAMQNRTVFQYSTIMDYGQRWNSDIIGLGKYDYAAIKMGYGNLINTYTNIDNLFKNATMAAQLYGYSTEALAADFDTSWWAGGIFSSQFQYLNNLIGVDANRSQKTATYDGSRNRMPVPNDWVQLEHRMSENFYRGYGDWSYVVAPYKFCGDEYAGNVGCYTWDTGVDPLEIVYNMGIELKDYYLLDAFKRDRYGFGLHGSALSYLSRVMTRWMEPMRGAGMYYALYSHVLKNYGWRGLWANGRNLGWGLRRASETGFETLANSLSSPAPGSYRLDPAAKVYRNFSYDIGMDGSELDVPLGTGKYPYTTFYDHAGYFYWDHAAYIGSFWEKLGALLTMTDSTVYFTTNYVGEQLNIGVGTSIGFNTMYPRQLSELFGGIVAEDTEMFAWTYDSKTKTVQPRAFFDPANSDVYTDVSPKPYLTPAKVPNAPMVDPSITNATMKLYAMIFGMALLPASFDPAFLDSFNICLEGTGDCYEKGSDEVEEARFTDPFTGRTYRALVPKYQEGWYSANKAVIEKANALAAEREAETDPAARARIEEDLRRMIEAMEMMRGIYGIYSTLQIVGT